MDEIVLGRVGHYHTPGAEGERGSCRVAFVANVLTEQATYVNLAVLHHDGTVLGAREDVQVRAPGEYATFHLTRDCPWGR